jgi:hypothetical protein
MTATLIGGGRNLPADSMTYLVYGCDTRRGRTRPVLQGKLGCRAVSGPSGRPQRSSNRLVALVPFTADTCDADNHDRTSLVRELRTHVSHESRQLQPSPNTAASAENAICWTCCGVRPRRALA